MAPASTAAPELPLDVLGIIFAPLALADWARCGRVARAWREAANLPSVLRQQLDAVGRTLTEAERSDDAALQPIMAEVLRSVVNRACGRCTAEALAPTAPLRHGPVVAANEQHTHLVLQSPSREYKLWHRHDGEDSGRLLGFEEVDGKQRCAPVIPDCSTCVLTATSVVVTRWGLPVEGDALAGTEVMQFDGAGVAPLLSPFRGGRLATLDAADKLCLWDLAAAPPTSTELMQGIPIGPQTSWMFSGLGSLLCIATNGRCLLWDLAAAPPRLYTLHEQEAPVEVMCFNGDGSALLTSPERGVYAVWDLANLGPQAPSNTTFEDGFFWAGDAAEHGILSGAFSQDSSLLLTWAKDHTCSQLWDLTSCPIRRIAILEGTAGTISYDCRSLITLTPDSGCLLWDLTPANPTFVALPMVGVEQHGPAGQGAGQGVEQGDPTADVAADLQHDAGAAAGEVVTGEEPVDVYEASFSTCGCGLWAWASDGHCWLWEFGKPPVRPPAPLSTCDAAGSSTPPDGTAMDNRQLPAGGSCAEGAGAVTSEAQAHNGATAACPVPDGVAAVDAMGEPGKQPEAGAACGLRATAFTTPGLDLALQTGLQQEQLLACRSADWRQGKYGKLTTVGGLPL